MFSWFRKPGQPPSPNAANPGHGHTALVAFKNARRTWTETDDLTTSLAATLNTLGHKAIGKRNWVELEGGFALVPQIVGVTPLDNAGVQTVTTIQTSHSTLVPAGVFEYQHSSGTDIRDSFAKGFKVWAELDLPVFLDALRAKPATCMVMEMSQGKEGKSLLARDRRLVLGPTVQMAQKTDPMPGDHDFCPCCLFTRSIEAFEGLVKDQAFHGVRLFVTRNGDGLIEADCRVNGVDHPAGAAALVRYAQGWPDRGVEYRKQYVCIQTREPGK